MEHRPEIDGLRAVAVLPVVLYHANSTWLPGGFVGVDVFFVISGFLITSIILPDLRAGTFSVLNFYERRIRRLFPALFAVIAFTLLVGALVMTPGDFERLAMSAISTALFASNAFHWWTVDYFSAIEPHPLIHTWSLAVEEQFYLVFPLLLLLCRRLSARGLTVVLAVLAVASFVWCLFVMKHSPAAAFYLPHLRAWELLMGAILAAGLLPAVRSRLLREIMILAGLGLIGSAFVLTDAERFPGYGALAPCIGAALIIHAKGPATASRLLGSGPLVAVGMMSYSLYLWHWPLLELARYYNVTPLTTAQILQIIAASLVIAFASWRFIELPYRRASVSQRFIFASGASMTAAAVAAGVSVVALNGIPARLSPDTLRYAEMLEKEHYFALYDRGNCFIDYNQHAMDYDLERCATPKDGLRILIWGDSFAANLYPGLRKEAPGHVYQYTATSCRPLGTERRRCRDVYERFPEILDHLKPDVVIIAGSWLSRFRKLGEDEFSVAVAASIKAAASKGAHVILSGQSPTYPVALPRLAFMNRSMRDHELTMLPAFDASELNTVLARVAAAENAAFFDFYDSCAGLECAAFIDGIPLHWDGAHMTMEGSAHYAKRLAEAVTSLRN